MQLRCQKDAGIKRHKFSAVRKHIYLVETETLCMGGFRHLLRNRQKSTK